MTTKRKILTTLTILAFSIAAKAIEIVPYPSVMKVDQEEVRLRSVEPLVSVSKELESEEYRLEVTPDGMIEITAGSERAAVWARHTLDQILLQARKEGRKNLYLPVMLVEDRPAFGYRGAMLDCSRHFWTVKQIKTFIDLISMHKLNVFHWHLTDNNGWRIEIKKYPDLVRIGSTRPSTMLSHHSTPRSERVYDGKEHSGYYSQAQIREIVEYASERGVEIIPEIELPGHSQAALASYPWLGCRGKGYKVMIDFARSYEVMCAGKATTLEFLKNVLDEVCELFPSEYIHIGGDEAPRDRWKECKHCQALMKRNGYDSEAQLQSYLINEVEKHLMSRGKRIIGWDEILEGGVSKTATVMSWRGVRGGINAAKMGNEAILVPQHYFYLDFPQSYSTDGEPMAFRKRPLPLSQSYSFDPYAWLKQSQKKYIKGIQANLWTEYISEFDHLQRMLLPRLAAMAEIAWCGSAATTYPEFVNRMETSMLPLYDEKGFSYAPYAFETASKVINALPLDKDVDLAEMERLIRRHPEEWKKIVELVEAGLLKVGSEGIIFNFPKTK